MLAIRGFRWPRRSGWRAHGTILALALVATAARGSEVVEVLPLTDRVLMVHFDDGHVEHHKRGEPRSAEVVVARPLDVAAASRAASYRVRSADDPTFAKGVEPARVGRKTKGTDFAWHVDQFIGGRAVNTRPDHAAEHWIYLVLPAPLRRGAAYTVDTGGLAGNGREWTVSLRGRAPRSEAVHVNLVGYVPSAPAKYGYVSHWMGDLGPLDLGPYAGRAFRLIDLDGDRTAFEGRLALRMKADRPETAHASDSPPAGNFQGADVYECDFSAFARPGRYVLEVDGVGASFPFRVGPDVYRGPFRATARALYHNRSGIALKAPYTEFARPAPHNPRETPGFAGRLIYTTVRFTEWGSEGGEAEGRCSPARRARSSRPGGIRMRAIGIVTTPTCASPRSCCSPSRWRRGTSATASWISPRAATACPTSSTRRPGSRGSAADCAAS